MKPGVVPAQLEAALADASGVLFLCSGNMVRSAFAELYARHRGVALPVCSAATHFRNDHILPETARALESRGVPRDRIRAFRPTHVDDRLTALDERTLVLAMAPMHLAALVARPALRRRAFLLGALLGESAAIDDPVLDGADFHATFERIARCVDALAAHAPRSAPGSGGSGSA